MTNERICSYIINSVEAYIFKNYLAKETRNKELVYERIINKEIITRIITIYRRYLETKRISIKTY